MGQRPVRAGSCRGAHCRDVSEVVTSRALHDATAGDIQLSSHQGAPQEDPLLNRLVGMPRVPEGNDQGERRFFIGLVIEPTSPAEMHNLCVGEAARIRPQHFLLGFSRRPRLWVKFQLDAMSEDCILLVHDSHCVSFL